MIILVMLSTFNISKISNLIIIIISLIDKGWLIEITFEK